MVLSITACFLAGLTAVLAKKGTVGLYSAGVAIPWSPMVPQSVDQSIVANGVYYLADRTSAGVHVINLANNQQMALVTGFITKMVNGSISSAQSGPNGLITLPDKKELWVGDGDGSIKVISLLKNRIVGVIPTGSKSRSDEFAYDQKRGIVVVTNPNEKPPYVTIINNNRTVMGKIVFEDAEELEQPAFNKANGMFYVSVPSTTKAPGGAISMLDIAGMKVMKTFPLPQCAPAGIVFGPNQHMFVGCSEDQIMEFGHATSLVVNGVDGTIVANVSGLAGIDQVTYSPTMNLYYAAAYRMTVNGTMGGAPEPIVAIINASSNALIQSFPTDNITAHSVAVDSKTGAVFVPIQGKGIQMFMMSGSANGTSPAKSGLGTSIKDSAPIAMVFCIAILSTFMS